MFHVPGADTLSGRCSRLDWARPDLPTAWPQAGAWRDRLEQSRIGTGLISLPQSHWFNSGLCHCCMNLGMALCLPGPPVSSSLKQELLPTRPRMKALEPLEKSVLTAQCKVPQPELP